MAKTKDSKKGSLTKETEQLKQSMPKGSSSSEK